MATLSACGGGNSGGAGNTTAPTATATCPNGAIKAVPTGETAATICPAANYSISPGSAATNVSADSVSYIEVTFDSDLDLASVSASSVSLKVGSTSIQGSVATTGSRAFRYTFSSKLRYVTAYSFTATVKDSLSRQVQISSTFTTSPINCATPDVAYYSGDACHKPILANVSGSLSPYWAFEDTGLVSLNNNLASDLVLTRAITTDLNGDGVQDLVLVGTETLHGAVQPLRSSDFLASKAVILLGGQTVKSGTSLFDSVALTSVNAGGVVAYDINGDGKDDIFVAASGPDVADAPGAQSQVAISSGSTYITASLPPQISFLHSVSAGKIAGKSAIYAGALWGQNKSPFLYVYNNGSFSVDRSTLPSIVTDTTTNSWAPTVVRPLRSFTASKLIDVNGDGFDDLILGMEGLSSYNAGPAIGNYIVFGNSSGLSAGTLLKLPDPSSIQILNVTALSIEVADLNNDGKKDIVIVYTNAYGSRGVQILRNDGSGSFTDVSVDMLGSDSYLIGWAEFQVRPIDVNGDGCMDLVLPYFKVRAGANAYGEVFLNDCKGRFVNATSVFTAAMSDLSAKLPKGLLIPGGQFLIPVTDYTGRVSFYIPLLDDYNSSGQNGVHFFKLDNLKNMPTPVDGVLRY